MKTKMMKTGGATAKRTPKAKNGTVTKRVPKADNGGWTGPETRDAIHGINQALGLNDRSYTNSKGTTTKKHSSESGVKYIKVTKADGTTYNKVAPSNVIHISKNGGATFKKGGVVKKKK